MGIPTVGLANIRERMERINYPRGAVVKFPRGATVGRPHDAAMQRQVLLDTLEVLRSAGEPGTLVELPQRWGGS